MTDPAALQELADTLEALAQRQATRKLQLFKPYPKQREFLNMGAAHRERLLMAGNQLGKSETGAYETALHLTGEYPSWWAGRRWHRAVRWWAAGESSLVVRDVQQKKLCGAPGVEAALGTGFIPKANFADRPTLARGVTDAYDTLFVRHRSGGVSTLTFKSYEQGRTKLQGDSVDGIWADEEPDSGIYSEMLARITATKGIIYTTFTPLKGMSDVVLRFVNEASPDRGVVTMTIDDAEHISPEDRAKIVAGFQPHEREARAMGIPMLGSGRIFTTPESTFATPLALDDVPPHWFKLWAIDFGIAHPFAAVLLIWDKDTDIIYILHALRMPDALPLVHAQPMKSVAADVPVAWPQDGTAREKGSGETLASLYKKAGLRMLPEHATWSDGGVSTEAAVMEMRERLETGRLKVAPHLKDWFEEYRLYHRKDGQIVKVKDDLLSATQKGLMAKRFARQVTLGGQQSKRRREMVARDVDFDLS